MTRLFVYGTLRRNGGATHLLGETARFLGEATVAGRLVALGPYSALVAGDGEVAGEVFEIDPAMLPRLDEYEGSEYRRELLGARLTGNEIVEAWTYVLRHPGS